MERSKGGTHAASLYLFACLSLIVGCQSGTGEAPVASLDLASVGGTIRVEEDLVLEAGEHFAPAPPGGAVLRIVGRRGVELDLDQVLLRGAASNTELDRARGVAIEIIDCRDVTLRGGTLTGYRVGVLVRNSRDVRIEGLRVSDFHAQRLKSSSATPDAADRLETTPVDGESWIDDYGAAIAVIDSSNVSVRDCHARRGQNGVLLVRSLGCEVLDGDFSYLSGWGVALWRADGCVVARNRLDACVRGPVSGPRATSFGAAGILIAGRSEGNLLAFNRALGGGAGALVVKGAGGGALDTTWYGNLFAPANGPGLALEGGGGHRLLHNRVTGAREHGIALEAPAGALLFENHVEGTHGAAIAIEGGTDCFIAQNTITKSDRGLVLRNGCEAPILIDNLFRENGLDLVLEGVFSVEVADNSFFDSTGGLDLTGLEQDPESELEPKQLWARLGRSGAALASGRAQGARLRKTDAAARRTLRELRFEPPPVVAGTAMVTGLDLGRILELPRIGPFGPWDPESGLPWSAPLATGGLLAGRGFNASWFRFDEASDPRRDLDAWRAQRFDAVARGKLDSWDDPWGDRGRRREVGPRSFGLIAKGSIEVPRSGQYRLDATFGDGLRILVDGDAVLEEWTWHPVRTEQRQLELERGSHEMVIEYFQLDGGAELSLSLSLETGAHFIHPE